MKRTRGVAAVWLLYGVCQSPAPLQAQSGSGFLADYTGGTGSFPLLYRPFRARLIPEPDLSNAAGLAAAVRDGTLRLSLEQVITAVIENNLAITSARYYPAIAQTDLLRAGSGALPREIDASQIPSGVFAGAEGGSILGTAGGGGGGSSNPEGITGAAGRVSVRPSGLFDPSLASVSVWTTPPAR